MPSANNKGADPRSLISAFVVRCLDSIIPLVSISETSSPNLASVAEQAVFFSALSDPNQQIYMLCVCVFFFLIQEHGMSDPADLLYH